MTNFVIWNVENLPVPTNITNFSSFSASGLIIYCMFCFMEHGTLHLDWQSEIQQYDDFCHLSISFFPLKINRHYLLFEEIVETSIQSILMCSATIITFMYCYVQFLVKVNLKVSMYCFQSGYLGLVFG